MNAAILRRLALSLPASEKKAHFGKPNFRVKNRILTTLPSQETAVVTDTQGELIAMAGKTGIFTPVKAGWGHKGWTQMRLKADQMTLEARRVWTGAR